MGSSEKDNVLIIFAEAEIQGASALVVGCLERGNGKAKCRCKWLAELRDGVDKAVEGVKLRATNGTGHLRLTKSHLNFREASRSEDSLDSIGSSHCIVKEECVMFHANPHEEWAKWDLLPSVGKGNRVDRSPHYTARVEVLGDLRADLAPRARNGVAIDRAQLTDEAPYLRTLAFGPGRTRLVNTWSTAGHIEKILIRIGITVGETG